MSDLLTPWAHRLLFDGTAHTVTVAMMCDWTMAILWEGPEKGQFRAGGARPQIIAHMRRAFSFGFQFDQVFMFSSLYWIMKLINLPFQSD